MMLTLLFSALLQTDKLPQVTYPFRLVNVTEAYPNWSPDGKKLLFESNAAGNMDIYVVNTDGTGLVKLIDSPKDDITPVWSPDGSKIVFVSERDGNREVYTCNADGTDQRNITNNPGNDLHPVWSADGKTIMFGSNRGKRSDDYDIYTMNVDGSGLKQLTSGPEVDTYSSWSPDGTKIITRRVIMGKTGEWDNSEVFIMDADGKNEKNLTSADTYDGWPTWTPDGKKIMFSSGPGQSPTGMYMMNPDGSDKTPITFLAEGQKWLYDTQPNVSKDGKWIAFARYRPGINESADICVMQMPVKK